MAYVNPSLRIQPHPILTPAPVKRSSDAPSRTTAAFSNGFKSVMTNPAVSPTIPKAVSPTIPPAATPTIPPAVVSTPTPPKSVSPSGGIGTMSPWPPLVMAPPTQTPQTVAMAPTAQSLFGNNPWITNAGGTGPGAPYSYNQSYFATPQTAATVAKMLGGTVVEQNALTPGGPFVQNQPNQMVQLPNGRTVNAGLIADMYNHGYTQQTVDSMVSAEVNGTFMV
jgi:hypothetical protein